MNATVAAKLYTDPAAMTPLLSDDTSGELNELAISIIRASATLTSSVHPLTRQAIASFLRPMNSYYSNLIEGHDTHPLDIDRALRQDFSLDKRKRSLQEEAKAHIELHQLITDRMAEENLNPFTVGFWQWVHQKFYGQLPTESRQVISLEGNPLQINPGQLRTGEVRVGQHIAPASSHLGIFIQRFEAQYDPDKQKSSVARIISLAAAHHRLAWIHPFLDGNGRVIRLFSDAGFMREGLDAGGLWSMSRGLARQESTYKAMLANADQQRYNDYDGRGNLSNKALVAFCRFFLETALDQIQYMRNVLDIDHMLQRLHGFVDLMVVRKELRPEARYVLESLFLKGEITKGEAYRLTGLSVKTAMTVTASLAKLGLLTSDGNKHFSTYRAAYPLKFSPILFSGLYPEDKEVDMLTKLPR